MAHFEEKILAYLDGSLSEADREEVLSKIASEHGAERALFDAHLRLQDMYSVVRKPVSAPLSLQRDLASQIPVLAIKLPYLAAPAKRRNPIAAGWLSAVRSSWVNVFLFFAAALLVGGVWYAVTTNSHRGPASTATYSAVGNQLTAGASGATVENTTPNTAPLPASVVQNNLHETNGSNETNGNGSASASSTIVHSSKMNSTKSSRGSNAVAANRSNANSANAKETLGIHNTNFTETLIENAATKANSSSAIEPSVNGNLAKPAYAQDLPPLPLHAVAASAAQPANFQSQRAMPINPIVDENASNYAPWRVYASSGARFLLPASTLSSYVKETGQGIITRKIVTSTEAGAEYEFTPWTSAGVRMGLTNFAQYQSFTHPGTSPIFYSQYSDVDVVAVPAVWSALVVTQTFNPLGTTRFSVSLTGGPAFTAPVSWLGMIEGDIAYDLSPTLMLRGGVSFDMEQVKQSTSGTGGQPNSTAGFITASTGGALRSDAFGLNLGISFHP